MSRTCIVKGVAFVLPLLYVIFMLGSTLMCTSGRFIPITIYHNIGSALLHHSSQLLILPLAGFKCSQTYHLL